MPRITPGSKCVAYVVNDLATERIVGRVVSVNRDGLVVVAIRGGGWLKVPPASIRQAVVR